MLTIQHPFAVVIVLKTHITRSLKSPVKLNLLYNTHEFVTYFPNFCDWWTVLVIQRHKWKKATLDQEPLPLPQPKKSLEYNSVTLF